MNWDKLLSVKRLGKKTSSTAVEEMRTEFQRDFDRLIFSSPFRRLQNKTQVFPLPGSVFVHNRLTHSLEVASVGRSLGNMISLKFAEKDQQHPLISEIGAVVAAACLAHDLGNPPFGHSGEDAIKEYFANGSGNQFINTLTEAERADFTSFHGNANSLRLLTNQFNGRREGGYALTYTMLASIVKYPYESTVNAKKAKFGFFQSEKELYSQIANELGIIQLNLAPVTYVRHPLVYLVEAADDICYQIMDIEDAHKLKILSYDETVDLYMGFYDSSLQTKSIEKIEEVMKEVTDRNEQIAYLRAGVINLLVKECVSVFEQNYHQIMNGQFEGSLMKKISPTAFAAMKKVSDISVARVYAHQSVVEIELAGFKIISTLLDIFINAVLRPSPYGKKLLAMVPQQYMASTQNDYSKIQSVVDFVTGMTDVYALDLYRKLTGIGLPKI